MDKFIQKCREDNDEKIQMKDTKDNKSELEKQHFAV